eukprot:TRINITY_DN2007_c0_g1_i2.p1 TRINITY_DN2007_c0_g1~~TRINITY_DN2007_c0_g1_i2.p1  ORF type:complete len:552 (-),score=170.23 TRINITY_DN2007_c0_g1_i2:304-1959(-)
MATQSALQFLAPNAQASRRPLMINRTAATGLAEIMGTNLGPKGSVKMLVSGAGQIKLTKDGQVLLSEMAIQHPTAMMIARAATAQDDITGDGTTSITILISQILRIAEEKASVHPRVLVDGLILAKAHAFTAIDQLRKTIDINDRQTLEAMALCSVSTKVPSDLAVPLSRHVVDAIETLRRGQAAVLGSASGAVAAPAAKLDLHMVEIMHMKHKLGTDTQFVAGLVLDHGGRHPGMPQKLEDCYVLTCNVSLEYEKSELTSVFVYDSAEKKDQLAKSERQLVTARVQQIIDLKVKLCGHGKGSKGFVVINQKGIDPPSLEMLARENILGLRRAKRRNMERLQRACGGAALFDLDGMSEADLGRATRVWQHVLGEESYTFVEGTAAQPTSCTILVKGAYEHTISQIKDAIRDGLRAVYNAVEEGAVLPGAGASEVAMYRALQDAAKGVEGKKKIGVQMLADALLAIPRQLAMNAGLDADDTVLRVMDAQHNGAMVGMDLATGGTQDPFAAGIYDNVTVKRQMIQSAAAIASQLLLVDEILKAGSFKRDAGPG